MTIACTQYFNIELCLYSNTCVLISFSSRDESGTPSTDESRPPVVLSDYEKRRLERICENKEKFLQLLNSENLLEVCCRKIIRYLGEHIVYPLEI